MPVRKIKKCNSRRGSTAVNAFERLEDRRLMSVSVTNGILRVSGNNSNNRVDVDQSASGELYVFENHLLTAIVPGSSVNAIAVDAYGGDDWVQFHPAVTKYTTVYAGAGNDVIIGSKNLDYVFAGLGNDYIDGADGNDSLEGDAGFDTIVGGNGHDNVSGGSENDILYGGNGYDTVHGWDGDDHVLGDADNDQVFGDNGNDTVYGGTGQDWMYGGAGNDRFYAKDSTSDFTVDGGTGYDTAQVDKKPWYNPWAANDKMYGIESSST